MRYAGSEKFTYCIEVSDRPHLTAMFPMAVQQGTTAELRPIGYGFDDAPPMPFTAAVDDSSGWRSVRYESTAGATNEAPVLISPHPQYVVAEASDTLETATPISLPSGVSGRISQPDTPQIFSFDAVQGHYYRFELEAARHGLPMDGLLEAFNADGKKLAEADDTRGSPHAGAWAAKDSRLHFRAPADGRYYIAVSDLNGGGGDRLVYYLKAEPDGPDFQLFGEYYYAMLAPGTRMLWFARIQRLNGFDGPVTLGIEGLPPGVELTPATIPAGMDHCALILSAADDAEIDAGLVRVYGTATVARPRRSAPRNHPVRAGDVRTAAGRGQRAAPLAVQDPNRRRHQAARSRPCRSESPRRSTCSPAGGPRSTSASSVARAMPTRSRWR